MKKCKRCLEEKPDAEFYAVSKFKAGRDSTCARCRRKLALEHRLQNIEYYRLQDKVRATKPERVAANIANTQRWRREHPDRYRAVTAANNAVRDGRLTRGTVCEAADCDDRRRRPQMHHDDYSEPLAVRWLCKPCHAKADAARRAREADGQAEQLGERSVLQGPHEAVAGGRGVHRRAP